MDEKSMEKPCISSGNRGGQKPQSQDGTQKGTVLGSSAPTSGRQSSGQKKRELRQNKVWKQKKRDAVTSSLYSEIEKLKGENDGLRESAQEKADAAALKEAEDFEKEEKRVRDALIQLPEFTWHERVPESRYLWVLYILVAIIYLCIFVAAPNVFFSLLKIPGTFLCFWLFGEQEAFDCGLTMIIVGYPWLIFAFLRWAISHLPWSIVRHRITVLKRYTMTDHDFRADTLSLGKLKHEDALYCDARYQSNISWWTLSDITMVVSLEMFSQITTAANVRLNMGEGDVYKRLRTCAESTQSVNINRYWTLKGRSIVQDTILLAYGYFMQRNSQCSDFPFPELADQ
jgi:hypothetical protein